MKNMLPEKKILNIMWGSVYYCVIKTTKTLVSVPGLPSSVHVLIMHRQLKIKMRTEGGRPGTKSTITYLLCELLLMRKGYPY